MAVAGIKDRTSNRVEAKVVPNTKSETMSRFIMEHVEDGAKIYTDDALTYHQLPNHETVKHSVGEYVRGQAHTNGVESFWSMLKRSYTGTFHKISPKHLDRYVARVCGLSQSPSTRHSGSDAPSRRWSGWEASLLSAIDR